MADFEKKYGNLIKTPQKGSAEYGKVQKDAQQEYLDRLKAIDMRIKQTQALRNADMNSVRRNNDLAQRDINNEMFQQYLANRERMGGRGVANSGLMADAQIRLNANKQDRLADLYSQTQDKLADVNRTYAPQQTELLGERQNVRQSKIFQEMFDRVMENRAREAQLLQPLVQNEFSSKESQKKMDFEKSENALKLAAEKALSDAQISAANTRSEAELNFKKDELEGLKGAEANKIRREKLAKQAEIHKQNADEYNQEVLTILAQLSQTENDSVIRTLTQKMEIAKLKALIENNVAQAYLSGDKSLINQSLFERKLGYIPEGSPNNPNLDELRQKRLSGQ